MTDPDLIAKKLAFIETCVRELETLARPELVETDVRERRFVEHTLQIAIQAALDVASHIVSDERLGEPRTNRDHLSRETGAGFDHHARWRDLTDLAVIDARYRGSIPSCAVSYSLPFPSR